MITHPVPSFTQEICTFFFPWRLTWNTHRGSPTPFSCLQASPPAAAQAAVERRNALILQLSVQVLVPRGQLSKWQCWLLGWVDLKLLLAECRRVKLMQRCFSVSRHKEHNNYKIIKEIITVIITSYVKYHLKSYEVCS